ncbi:unnamed protein product [Ixodes pacificus]
MPLVTVMFQTDTTMHSQGSFGQMVYFLETTINGLHLISSADKKGDRHHLRVSPMIGITYHH